MREHAAGNPLISAVVVSKKTMEPGVGFWNIAKGLGIKIGDSPHERQGFWRQSLNDCYDRWQPRTVAPQSSRPTSSNGEEVAR